MDEPDEYGWYTDSSPYDVLDSSNSDTLIECVVDDGYIKICELDWWYEDYSYEVDGELVYDSCLTLDIYVKDTRDAVYADNILKWRILDEKGVSSSAKSS